MRFGRRKTFIAPTPPARREAMRGRYASVQLATPGDASRYLDELERLADLLPASSLNWYLEGGMALAAHLGEFKRKHSDVDVGVLGNDVRALEECLAMRNYRLFTRNPYFHALEYTGFDLVRAISADEIQSGRRAKRLTAIKVNDAGRVEWKGDVLPRFDIHVHRKNSDVVYVTHKRFPFPADLFESTSVYETPQHRKIRLASIPFIYYFKIRSNRPSQVFDRQLIENSGLLSTSDRTRVHAILDGES